MSKNNSCPLCEHPAREQIEEIYQEEDKNISKTKKWFEENFNRSFPQDNWDKHCLKHLERDTTKFALKSMESLKALKRRALSNESSSAQRIPMIKEIAWEFMTDIYANKEKNLRTKEQKNMHQKQSKQFVELAKMYREFYQTELEIIGVGKTEEEQKAAMEHYVVGLLKRGAGVLEEFPEAKDKLDNYLNMAMGQNDAEFDRGEVIDPEEDRE